jgi:hypothetical protein
VKVTVDSVLKLLSQTGHGNGNWCCDVMWTHRLMMLHVCSCAACTYDFTRRHNPERQNRRFHRRENLMGNLQCLIGAVNAVSISLPDSYYDILKQTTDDCMSHTCRFQFIILKLFHTNLGGETASLHRTTIHVLSMYVHACVCVRTCVCVCSYW